MLMLGSDYGGEIRTLAEYGPYQDYFVVTVTGRFNYQAVIDNKDERLRQFINLFKQKYKKTT